MGRAKHKVSVLEYGIVTANSNTVLTVTTDRAEAERALHWITDARIVTYSDWHPENNNSTSTPISQTALHAARLSSSATGSMQASAAGDQRSQRAVAPTGRLTL